MSCPAKSAFVLFGEAYMALLKARSLLNDADKEQCDTAIAIVRELGERVRQPEGTT